MNIKSDGTPWRPIVHVRDIARAFLLALDAPREIVGGKAFNVVATKENYQIRDLAAIVANTVEDCAVEIAPNASPDLRNYRVNGDRFSEAVGFQASAMRAPGRPNSRLPSGMSASRSPRSRVRASSGLRAFVNVLPKAHWSRSEGFGSSSQVAPMAAD